jgi:energy-coupling factor transporter ATP-binding protein EcfA2
VISSVTVTNLRGINSGALADLTQLTILVGPNGSGKSTVLDALAIGLAKRPGDAMVDAILRRQSRESTSRWLFPAQPLGPATIRVTFHDDVARKTTLTMVGPASSTSLDRVDVAVGLAGKASGQLGTGQVTFGSTGSIGGNWSPTSTDSGKWSPALRFIDMRFGAAQALDLVDVLTAAKSEGRATAARDLMKSVVPSLENLEILKVGQGFGVALVNERTAVPLSVSGDGIRGLARLCLELAAHAGGVVLLEEPEVHQHPRSLKMSAKAIIAAVKRGIQVVLATHSLELIDFLVEAAESEGQLGELSVQRLLLNDGVLDAKRFPGDQTKRIRGELELELR